MPKSINRVSHKLKNFEDAIVSLILVTENDEDIVTLRMASINKMLSFLNINYEILIVDNCSTDATVNKIKENNAIMKHGRILVLSKTYDKEVAFTAGIDACVGDYAIIFDIYSDPEEMIPYILTHNFMKGTDIVIGRATVNLRERSRLCKMFLSAVERISKHGFSYRESFLMGLNRKAINSIIRTRRKSRNFGYINTLIGLTKETVDYKPVKKYKYKFKKEGFMGLLGSVLDITMSNSFRPIRLMTLGGMGFSLLYILYVVVIVVLDFVFGMKNLAPQGWITLSTVLGVTFFILFSILAIISEYVIRILGEARQEPLYFVSEEIGKSNIIPEKGTLNIV